MSIVKQGASYGFVGLLQIGLDSLIFIVLTKFGMITGAANIIGRVSGAIMGFWLNGKWTFSNGEMRPLGARHLGKFLISWTLTTFASTMIVMSATHLEGLHVAWIIKPVADLALAAFGFAISKYWIYR